MTLASEDRDQFQDNKIFPKAFSSFFKEIPKNIRHSDVLYAIKNSKIRKVFVYIQKKCMLILKYKVGVKYV